MPLILAVLAVAFWLLLAIWPLVYVVYPAVVLLFGRMRGDRVLTPDLPWPSVAILVAAHNEEETIARCARSCLAQEYPGDPPPVVFGLDGCTDRTAEILRGIGDPRIRVIEHARRGKAATDNALLTGCDAEVVAMTSAGAEYAPGTLRVLVEPFRSSRVGCAGGVFAPRPTGASTVAAESSYFVFEYRLMRAESRLGVLAKASGTALAFRRSLFRPIPLTSDADVTLPFLAALRGARVEFIPSAVVYDDGPKDQRSALKARRRMGRHIANVSRQVVELVRAHRWGAATSLTIHKLLRWLAPSAFILCAISAALLGLLATWAYLEILGILVVAGLFLLGLISLLRGNGLSVVAGFIVSQAAFVGGSWDAILHRGVRLWDR
jgi:cellulose synthase/poly-beta-1,6-N-acetylglucosamine synthase-like glycosyltransferase